MDKILENKIGIKSPVIRQFIIYGFVALIPTVVDFSLFYILIEFAGFYYMASLVFAFMIGILVSYISQKNLTFKNSSKKYAPQFSIFCLISLVGLLISAVVVFGTVEYFGLWYIFGKVIATIGTYFWNFFAHRYVTFKKFQ